jgi:hypothetical protein
MALDSNPLDFQSQISKLAEIAKAKGDDFRIKIMRKASPAAPLTSVATFDGANVGHFAVPEAWLVPFCGGGPVFVLWAYHASEPNVMVEQVFPPSINGAIREPVSFAAVASAGWNGPTTLLAPQPPQAAKAPNPSDVASLFAVPAGSSASGGAAREAASPSPGGPGHSSDAEARLHAAQLQLLDQQRRQDNDRLEKMIEAQTKAGERQIAAIMDFMRNQKPAEVKAGPTLVEQIVPLAAAFTPILTAIMARGDADKKGAMEREARREEREAKSRDEAAKAQSLLFEKLSSGNSETAKVMQSMADVVANSMKAQLQTFATIRDLMPGEPQDEGITGIVKALAPAAAEYFALRGSMAPQAPQLPPRPPAPAVPPAPGQGDAPAPATAPAPAEGTIAEADPASLIAEVEEAIKAHHDPAELAANYVEAMTANVAFAQAVAQAGGTIPLFQGRLGSWVMDQKPAADGQTNGNYLRTLIGALRGAAAPRGVSI